MKQINYCQHNINVLELIIQIIGIKQFMKIINN